MKRRTAVVMLATLFLAGAPLLAAPGELILKTGDAKFGDVNQKEDTYEITLRPSGVIMTIPKSDVAEFKPGTLKETFARKKAAVPKDDVAEMYKLARWAQQHEMNEEMGEMAREILKVRPNHAQAKLLLGLYEKNKAKTTTNGSTTTKPEDGTVIVKPPIQGVGLDKLPRLTEQDINTIRLLEMQKGEQVRVRFEKDFLDKFWQGMAKQDPQFNDNSWKQFLRQPPHRQLELIMDKTPPDFYHRLSDSIHILNDPKTMEIWRSRIHPWVLNSCGAANCHGGTDGKVPWQLINLAARNDEKIIYTNFYTTSEFAGKSGRMLDRDRAEESLLIQYALPPEAGTTAIHPKVAGREIPIALRSKSDNTYKLIYEWIRQWDRGGLRFPKLDYHITFPPPKAGATPANPKTPAPGAPPAGPPSPPL